MKKLLLLALLPLAVIANDYTIKTDIVVPCYSESPIVIETEIGEILIGVAYGNIPTEKVGIKITQICKHKVCKNMSLYAVDAKTPKDGIYGKLIARDSQKIMLDARKADLLSSASEKQKEAFEPKYNKISEDIRPYILLKQGTKFRLVPKSELVK